MDIKIKPKNIEFKQLTYTVPDKNETRDILKSVSGEFKSGELTAIMGPSGAGKSTLLNILTGFIQTGVVGEVKMNNAKVSDKKYRNQCCYILQDDNLYPTFTVEETMMLSASLKISGISLDEKKQIVNNVLNTLQLTHTKSTRCGHLSGGQKKRLSIALELLGNPPVLFLDEPTTGLDSLSSANCIRLLHHLSREGRTIIFTIHQPAASIFESFDHIYVLADGNCVYQGSANNTVPYLSSIGLQCPHYHNPADFLLEVANKEYGDFIPTLTKASKDDRWRLNSNFITDHATFHEFQIESDKTLVSRSNSNESKDLHVAPSEWTKFLLLVGRCHIHYYRDWTVTYLKLMLHITTAILVSLMYGDSGINANKSVANVGLFLIGVCYLWYTSLMPSILKFPSEVAILKKETFNNWYPLRTYFCANVLTTTPIHIVLSTTFSGIVFIMTDQPMELERFMKFCLCFIFTTMIADGIGLIIGSVFNPVNGTFVGATLSAYKVAFSGFIALHSHISKPMRLMSNVSSMRYLLESVVLSIYDLNRADMKCPNTEMSPKLILQELGMTANNFEFDISVIVIQMVAFKALAFLLLKRRLKKS
ncbi:ATP-binding cassette subfamily G member 4 [Pseudolycoriella hygida]|uniref:ATP-binding cassette subfamily G member 4 n=1 Tax=Pseudolycoriella hygida TaxID=35572 RepID=A0A9Q0N4Q7_9DIPT|nr:ATP-binding cassette subfamily G member 4 [Pseudolycoriella hygida]